MTAPRTEHLAEGVTLYLGDCREILPTLGKVDAVVTDPPYGLGREGWDDAREKLNLHGWFSDWMTIAPTALFTFGAKPEHFAAVLAAADGVADLWRVMVWHKPFTLNGLRANFKWHYEPVIWIGRIGTKPPHTPWFRPDVFSHMPVTMKSHPESVGHNSQKPVALYGELIEDIQGVILDPFMGSGTTGVAAVKLGRKFIGIEIVPQYFETACRRISEALKQPDMFIEKPKSVRQEAML